MYFHELSLLWTILSPSAISQLRPLLVPMSNQPTQPQTDPGPAILGPVSPPHPMPDTSTPNHREESAAQSFAARSDNSTLPTDPSTLVSNTPSAVTPLTGDGNGTVASSTSASSSGIPTSLPARRGPKGARHLQPPQKSGRKSTWPPKKLAWLESHLPQFNAYTDSGAFYDRIMWLWYRIFGRSLPTKVDPEGDIDEQAAIDKQDSEEFVSEEVRAAWAKEEQALRQV